MPGKYFMFIVDMAASIREMSDFCGIPYLGNPIILFHIDLQ